MKFLLYCGNDPASLGIEDDQGNWDMTAFRDHVDSCKPCTRFVDLFIQKFMDDLMLLPQPNRKE